MQIIHDGTEVCPYLPGRIARMPLQMPLGRLTGERFDELLAQGYRRYGPLVYQTRCPNCQACEAIRIPVNEFVPRRSLARTLRIGGERIKATVSQSKVDRERIELFNKHRSERELNRRDGVFTESDYVFWFVESCVKTVEIEYRIDNRLIGVAICDLGATSLSAVYTFFDPDFESLSPGSYSILYQWQQCQLWGLDYLYLGFYVAGSPHMRYKARFKPHERLIGGGWRRDDDPRAAGAA